ncbi:hypothetical protein ACFWU5_22080 [Nocardia sp. NPDC058640]|uniref:hypothetical protein n=1 Tax=Nocardia sp. NPDC058640 TaxID=3346571 RepID=UPI00365493FE
MAKRKITVTVDEEIVDLARELGDSHLSAVVNAALTEHVDRLARRAALGALIESWDRELGPVSDSDTAYARAAFDELDAAARMRDIA